MSEARNPTPEDIVRAAFRLRYGKSGDKEAAALFSLLAAAGLALVDASMLNKVDQEVQKLRDEVRELHAKVTPLASGGG